MQFCLMKLLAAGFLEVSSGFAHNLCLDISCKDCSSADCGMKTLILAFKLSVCKRFPLFLCWQMMLWGVQDGLGQCGVVALPSELPACGNVVQGDALQRKPVSLGVSFPIFSRLISCADRCLSVFVLIP